MKRISSDIIIKILILLCFGIFYFKIIKNNEIIMYVHPRIIPFAILGMLAMFAIAIFLITDSRRTKKKNIKLRNYVIFIIPLVMVFFMQSTSANSSIKADDMGGNFSGLSSTNLTYDNSKPNPSNQKINNAEQGKYDDDLYIKDNVIEVDINNFLHSFDELTENANKYDGQEIEITGFVYKDTTLNDNEFIVGRFVMACCAADLQVVGIKCDSNSQEIYSKDTWVKVKGKLKTETVKYAVNPVIVVEHIEKDPNPKTEYLYPF
ncbi:TIGR03943 family putative permease subunit [Clostridium beijerinckii]|mgnify:CR=1 FL=1|jgi:Predicted membrane protein|uniref:TIGR03943 family protein n=2 Tax=Clostridium beijerinckii TaxID=1520 RepID=A0AAE2RR37_CLOBE|nr:TIGR03943 family protein [Clostridium beijerinckii]ABR36771.1 Protein of unknown function DUF1980 [Clostridium beijerinckii NCIMB 8052]AIU03262.1 hypothetical protein Cbs_4663 [Clostridium beijerinckii ATCC 35702]MBF7808582.1 TIGR03943 family protein [Clostridium beijerinckii]NRT22154.1 putative membrane protein [Clostridium beijerinckii]NRT65336.1 putative membrane protein [Clostridium beijerinckii]